MATIDKAFRVKNGLVVEGSTATVNGHDVITKEIFDAKGDLIVGTGSNTGQRLAVGTNGYILTADSSTTSGLTWAAAPSVGSFETSIVFEGTTANDFETTLQVTDPTADRTITFKDEMGVTKFYCWMATTDPGKKGVQQFHNKKGVARLIPGQYRTTWAVDKHQGKYDALCQRLNNVTVWRDANRDLTFQETVTDTGMFGINIHKAGRDSTWVENWSEGCQVFKRVIDFDIFMQICRKASKIHGNKFSYTLLESTDIV